MMSACQRVSESKSYGETSKKVTPLIESGYKTAPRILRRSLQEIRHNLTPDANPRLRASPASSSPYLASLDRKSPPLASPPPELPHPPHRLDSQVTLTQFNAPSPTFSQTFACRFPAHSIFRHSCPHTDYFLIRMNHSLLSVLVVSLILISCMGSSASPVKVSQRISSFRVIPLTFSHAPVVSFSGQKNCLFDRRRRLVFPISVGYRIERCFDVYNN